MGNYRHFKRLLDIFGAILLLMIATPFYIVIGVIILLQDGHHPIFKQVRVGKHGNHFDFYKFRSMPVNTANVDSTQREKLKITPFGRIIRRTNLDELPQFYNILKGDMSLIGPRPAIPSQKELLAERRTNGAINMSPGMTGWAQVNAYDHMPIEEKAQLDGYYANNVSFFLDLKIILRTFLYFTKKPPVY